MTTDPRDVFRARIGETLEIEPDHVALFARGRVALYAIIRGLDLKQGDEVIVPAFTCVAVPNAILYAGARPVFVDIDAATYNIDPTAAEAAIGPRTRVILAQNTFGLSADLERLTSMGARHGIVVVDDCTHGLGGRYHGRPNGTTAALSFFSTQWSKPLSTGLGGFAVARDRNAAVHLRRLEEAASEPTALRAAILRTLLLGAERAGHGRLFRAGRSAYRTMSHLGLVPGSSNRVELASTQMPDRFLAKLSRWQARVGLQRLTQLGTDIERRQLIARRYSSLLSEHGRTPAAESPAASHTFLRYPIRVINKQEFVSAAERDDIDLGDWFVSPLHPIRSNLDRWGYRKGTALVAEAACSEIVNLPTEPTLSDRDIDRVLRFLAARISQVR